MARRWLVLIAVAVFSTACGTPHAAGPPQQHLSRTAGVYIALINELRHSTPGHLYVDATATSSAGSQEIKPSGERPISAPVQKEVRSQIGVTFVKNPKRVIYKLTVRDGKWRVVGDTGIVGMS